jgi:hypothetical protein
VKWRSASDHASLDERCHEEADVVPKAEMTTPESLKEDEECD